MADPSKEVATVSLKVDMVEVEAMVNHREDMVEVGVTVSHNKLASHNVEEGIHSNKVATVNHKEDTEGEVMVNNNHNMVATVNKVPSLIVGAINR